MLKLFVDESYQRDHYYVAGVLANEKQASRLEQRLDELAAQIQARNKWTTAPEFHGHSLMNGLDDWKPLRDNFGACLNIYQKVLHAVRGSGAAIYLEGVDINRLNARYRYPDSPHEVVLRHLLERVNESCASTGEKCTVIADRVPQENDFNAAIQTFTRIKTPGYKGQQLLCIDGDLTFVDSQVSRGVQAADMSAYILRRHREENFASASSRKTTRRLVRALGDAVVYERKWIP